jgi:hypothetical protein
MSEPFIDDQHAELARLRAQVAGLSEQLAGAERLYEASARERDRLRAAVAALSGIIRLLIDPTIVSRASHVRLARAALAAHGTAP